MENIEISPEAKQLAKETEQISFAYKEYKIVIANQFVNASDDLKQIKGKYNEIEEKRKEMTRPLDEAKRRIMEFFRVPLERLAQAENTIKRAMLGYQQEQERIRAEAERKLQERAAKAEEKGKVERAESLKMQAAAVSQMETTPKVSGVATKTIWRAKIIDFGKLPDDYKLPDQSKLDRVAQATKGRLVIPGVEFYSEEIIAASARR